MREMTMIVTAEHEKKRLDVFVSEVSSVSRSHAQVLIDNELVSVNGKLQAKNYRLKAGDEVEIEAMPLSELSAEAENIPLDIVYEDDDIIVINKPSGMVVHPAVGNESGTLVNALMYHCKGSLSGINGVIRPGIVHRIDKQTSGLLVVAKTDDAHIFLSSLLKEHGIKRVYYAILTGHLKSTQGTVNAPIARHSIDRKRMAVVEGGRSAITHYQVLREYPSFSLAKMELETGRTHQIRVHMSYIGHPIVGDLVYGGGKTPFEKAHARLLDGQCLHAGELSFPHPRTKEIMHFESPLPDNFKALLHILEEL
ncbi:MAG: RluA family pseudouridine synthase [Clostridia bacterium]|nr:RluA family pseudouridine synthase [Clostridia bacterium]